MALYLYISLPRTAANNKLKTNLSVYFRNPTPSLSEAIQIPWEPATENQLKTMHIGRDLKMENGILTDRLRLWDSIYAKYIGTEMYR